MTNSQSIQKNIWYLLVISAYLGVAISYGYIYLVHFSLAIGLIFLTYYRFKEVIHSSLRGESVLIFIAYPASYLVSILWSDDLILAITYISQLASVSLLGLLVNQLHHPKYTHGKSYLIDWVLIGTLGFAIVESLTYIHWPISKYSEYANLFSKTVLTADVQAVLPSVFFWGASNLAYVVVLFAPYFANHSSKWIKFIGMMLIPITLVRASSRLGLVIVFIYYFYKMLKDFSHNDPKFILKLVAILTTIATATWFCLPEENKNDFRNFSLDIERQIYAVKTIFNSDEIVDVSRFSRREKMLVGVVNEWRKSPILGIGAGQLLGKAYDGVPLSTPHFYPLEVVAQVGLLGLFFFLFLIGRVIFMSKDLKIKETVLLFFIASPIIPSLNYFFPVWLFLGFATISTKKNS